MTIDPFMESDSSQYFYIPPTIQNDFDRFLMTDVPNVNFTFAVRPDWYDANNTTNIRGEIVPINWKSKYAGSDSATNFRTSLSNNIKKGDILLCENGEVYMVIWNVEEEINNKKTQIQKCNMNIKIERYVPKQINPTTGKVINQDGYDVIADSIPCIGATVSNRFEYAVAQNLPGIVPNHTVLFYVQFNSSTVNIEVGDQFDWYKNRYHIVDISPAELDTDYTKGLLTINAEKVAGGAV